MEPVASFEAAVTAILHHTKEVLLSNGFHFNRGCVCLKVNARRELQLINDVCNQVAGSDLGEGPG